MVYLLHGYSDNYANRVQNVAVMADCTDWFEQLIICPDGNFSSWYFDSPVKPEWKYETYIAVELVQ